MKKEELLKQYSVCTEKLLQYGFQKDHDSYILKESLNQELYVEIKIQNQSISIDVYEQETNEIYLPFHLKEATGSYVNSLKDKVEKILEDMIKNCFERIDIRSKIIHYIEEKYGTIPEYPWLDNPHFFTMKTRKKQKWYGLVMDIPYHKLGFKGDELVDVINLKNNPEKIKELIDYQNFFPAYHMNKKYWFSVLLNDKIDFAKLTKLIDESYQSIEM